MNIKEHILSLYKHQERKKMQYFNNMTLDGSKSWKLFCLLGVRVREAGIRYLYSVHSGVLLHEAIHERNLSRPKLLVQNSPRKQKTWKEVWNPSFLGNGARLFNNILKNIRLFEKHPDLFKFDKILSSIPDQPRLTKYRAIPDFFNQWLVFGKSGKYLFINTQFCYGKYNSLSERKSIWARLNKHAKSNFQKSYCNTTVLRFNTQQLHMVSAMWNSAGSHFFLLRHCTV